MVDDHVGDGRTAKEQLTALGISLQPCPAWCTGDHFGDDVVLDRTDGFHHTTDDSEIKGLNRLFADDPDVQSVQVRLTSWVNTLDAADRQPARVSLTIDRAVEEVELSPQQAREIAAELVRLAEIAEAD
ncbi:DUF6907 domain-containing protein [Nonomuraea zeae]|uniref:Uncharacterized protein n=1 Tax=Nonomuraea zeae TaxID=1642303 RepID=A0A5S4HJP4_9ACTN|nr:hypothetical protein [Nonomuraea zeae]TMR39600.1 hypothetical protein ETD85_00885 [Nonomuraea zeae]